MPAPVLTLTPMTELDAVNEMLTSIGQAPVNTLEVSGITDVSIARLTLHNTSRKVQSKGWHFNTDNDWPLTRDVNGKIAMPPTALEIDPEDRYQDLVVRLDPADSVLRLYDRRERTFVLTVDPEVEVKWFLAFAELPAAARAYIAARAGRVFQATQISSKILFEFTALLESETLSDLMRHELNSADTNIFNSSHETRYIAHRERS